MADASVSFQRIFSKVQCTLSQCLDNADPLPITSIFTSKISETAKHCMEAAVRNYVTRRLVDGANTDLNAITAITTVSIELVRQELSLPTLPVLILSDSFDTLTIGQCEQLFGFVEDNVAVWKEEIFFAPCKTSVLRMCNDLLRRLSRSQNTVFCGRILLFLARFFPFSERSGLNLVSEFNFENVTTFTNVENEDEDDIIRESQDGTPRLDYTLYTKFWSLQDFFRNPIQCFQKAPWRVFTLYCSDVLEAFKSFKLDNVQATKASQLTRALTHQTSTTDMLQADQYFAKYLTNQKLLDLQFSDANFRRYVLLQILILMQYLNSNIKFKQETLTDDQAAWVAKTEATVCTLLEETPPDGHKFLATVKHILKREEMWSGWKNDGCPEFKKPDAIDKNKTRENEKNDEKQDGENHEKAEKTENRAQRKPRVKRKVSDLLREADSRGKFSMGNAEMTRLWNLQPDNLEACRTSSRDFVPSLETYFSPAIEQLSTKSDHPESDRLVNDSNFGWRGLRLLACRSPHFFTHSASPIATLPDYLTQMIRKLAKDLPSQLSGDMKVDEEEEKEEEKVMAGLAEEEGVKDEEMEEDDGGERKELKAITSEEQQALAKNLQAFGKDKWKVLAKKLGNEEDEIEYIESKEGNEEARAAYMLKLWVEAEGDEANQEALLYTLGGLKMHEIANGVFN